MGGAGTVGGGGACGRADRWLWATRIFKTRTVAAAACRLGQVVLGEVEVKPSRILKVGDELLVKREDLTLVLEVVGIPDARVAAKRAGEYVADHTPAEEVERAAEERRLKAANKVYRIPGEGRPTKKDLREIQKYHDLERGMG